MSEKIVQYLNEAHATEMSLVRVLQSQIAMTPRGSYRSALEKHLEETRSHADRVQTRLGEFGQGLKPITTAGVGLVESLFGQLLALSKTPIDMIRGTGGEEKVLEERQGHVRDRGARDRHLHRDRGAGQAHRRRHHGQARARDPRRRGADARRRSRASSRSSSRPSSAPSCRATRSTTSRRPEPPRRSRRRRARRPRRPASRSRGRATTRRPSRTSASGSRAATATRPRRSAATSAPIRTARP